MNTLFNEYGGFVLAALSLVLSFTIFLKAFPYVEEVVKVCMTNYLG